MQHSDDSDHGLGQSSKFIFSADLIRHVFVIKGFLANCLKSVKAFMHDPNQHSKVVYDPDDFDKRTILRIK